MTENPYYAGPPRDYNPPDPADLTDPDHHRDIADRGRAHCLAALAQCGIRQDERGKWHTDTTTTEETR